MVNFRMCSLISLVILMYVSASLGEDGGLKGNTTDPKDMYVVRATVYQVGILTNRTNETEKVKNGHQETITFYRHNGTNLDLTKIPDPLVTNVTAENVLGVAPVGKSVLPWTPVKSTAAHNEKENIGTPQESEEIKKTKRDVAETPARVEKGAAVIPSQAGVQSIALPPLLALNKNMADIPVPIPNVSVVSYAKVNTLVKTP